jgi:hypothetical protein
MPNIFSQPGSLFPHTASQSTWHFSLGENFLHLSDGTHIYSFTGKLDLKGATLKKAPDVPIADFYNMATSEGKAQVHRSDLFSIYFTMQDGRTNPTYILRHVEGDTWSVQPSKQAASNPVKKNTDAMVRVDGTGGEVTSN